MPRAAGLADEIKERFGYESELIKGRNGVFEVTFDGELVFSKKSQGRFPEPIEVVDAIAAQQAMG